MKAGVSCFHLSMVVMIALMLTTARECLLYNRETKMGMSEKYSKEKKIDVPKSEVIGTPPTGDGKGSSLDITHCRLGRRSELWKKVEVTKRPKRTTTERTAILNLRIEEKNQPIQPEYTYLKLRSMWMSRV